LYSNASVLLLDDVLAALDVHTAKYIAREALRGDLVEGRTVLLVTHNIALAANIAGYVVVLGRSGRVAEHGTVEEVLRMDAKLKKQIEQERVDEDGGGKEGGDSQVRDDGKGKLVVPEEKAIGRVEFAAFALYLRAVGSPLEWTAFITFL
jgi:ABC-type glutathione transport system ATPase component